MAASVGIVLVSHSAALASGTADLASSVGGASVLIATAGGAPGGGLGTNAAAVEAAIRSAAAGGGGVVVLPDLGSAVLTVRALLAGGDLDDVPGGIEIADAPFVEGAIAAVVTAAAGGSLKSVAEAAREARHAGKL